VKGKIIRRMITSAGRVGRASGRREAGLQEEEGCRRGARRELREGLEVGGYRRGLR
jgi:hypothetical protein